MWTTFKDCLDSILSNLDDFAVIIFILIVGNKIADLLYRFIANFLERSLFAAQTIKLLLQIFIGVISFIHLVGDDIIKNASAGIAIGIGYAFQPYIISMFNGLMIHNDSIINKDVWIDIPDERIIGCRVYTIGLFNTILIDKYGNKILLSNSSLTHAAVTIKCESPWTNDQTMKQKTVKRCSNGKGWSRGPNTTEESHHSKHYLHYQMHHNPALGEDTL